MDGMDFIKGLLVVVGMSVLVMLFVGLVFIADYTAKGGNYTSVECLGGLVILVLSYLTGKGIKWERM